MDISRLESVLQTVLSKQQSFENEAQLRDKLVVELRGMLSNYSIAIEVPFACAKKGRYSCFDVVMKFNATQDVTIIEIKYHKQNYNKTNNS